MNDLHKAIRLSQKYNSTKIHVANSLLADRFVDERIQIVAYLHTILKTACPLTELMGGVFDSDIVEAIYLLYTTNDAQEIKRSRNHLAKWVFSELENAN